MELLHVSDLHITEQGQHPRLAYEHRTVIATGDVTDNGTREEYEAATRVLAPLVVTGLHLCPGNHDHGYLGNLWTPSCERRWWEFASLMGNAWYTELEEKRGGEVVSRVHLFCLDSCLPTTHPLDFACGEVGQRQLQALDMMLTTIEVARRSVPGHDIDKVIVALHHHPFIHTDPTMKLMDDEAFFRVLAGRVDLVLFGHKHAQRVYYHRHGVRMWLAAAKYPKGQWAITIHGDHLGIEKEESDGCG